MEENCGSCKYFRSIDEVTLGQPKSGKCFRFPPTLVLLQRGNAAQPMSFFPVVHESHFCGEHDTGKCTSTAGCPNRAR